VCVSFLKFPPRLYVPTCSSFKCTAYWPQMIDFKFLDDHISYSDEQNIITILATPSVKSANQCNIVNYYDVYGWLKCISYLADTRHTIY
jgi:hypothetical protein